MSSDVHFSRTLVYIKVNSPKHCVMSRELVCLFEVLFYIANQTGFDAQYYDGDRIKSVAR